MLRRITAITAVVAAFSGLAGCAERVPTPEWNNRFKLSVWKRSCTVTDLPSKKEFSVSGWGATELPDGFKAQRGKRYCEISGQDNITCHYGTSDKVSYCYKTKPDEPAGNW